MIRSKILLSCLLIPYLLTACGGSGDSESAPPPPETITIALSDAASVIEGTAAATLHFRVTLSAASSRSITVGLRTRSGTATSNQDFVDSNASVVIPAGTTSIDFGVPIIDDAIDEPDESVHVDLTSTSFGTLGRSSATGMIIDDDDPVGVSVSNGSTTEGHAGSSTISFDVSLSSVSEFDVVVDFATTDVSATAGIDYQAQSGSLSIPAGSVTGNIDVVVNGDLLDEADETISLNLSNPVNAVIAVGTATGTIIDDDSAEQSGLASRPQNLTCVAPDRPTSDAAIAIENAFPVLPTLVKPVGLIQTPGDTGSWYVIEQDGRVLRFANDAGANLTTTFIDIRSPSDPIDVDSGPSEAGLLGMAFHPDYGNGNRYVYLSYTLDSSPLRSVIARFESKDNGATLDATDATILMTLEQPFINHNGGQIEFGPDGYLYIHFGDGGSANDPGDRAQNTNNLFGSMLRIDVNGVAPYGIPFDNPFAGNALCNDGDGGEACPEIYAWGLRNAWKWSFDPITNQLWLGDVGQDLWEEVNLIELGGNYGWRCREGAHDKITTGNCPDGLIDPIIEYSNVSVGDSITGGLVYRGTWIPELIGRYVFADYVRGKVFASIDNGDGTYSFEALLDNDDFISAFAAEPSGELLYLNYMAGNVRRIVQAGGGSVNTIPDLLSETGCVVASDPALPASGLIPYDINVPFWSDGAVKERWYAIPEGETIDVNAQGDWLFPIGTVLMKHFRLNGVLVETRLFMRHTNGGEWAGYTYEWNDAGTDADRVIGGKIKGIGAQDWIYPSESQCMQCHTAAANFSLGLEHGQLNRDLLYPSTGITANQLYTADFVDLLSAPLADDPDNLVRFERPDNVAASLEERARSYLHSNCAGCHRPGGPTPSAMNLQWHIPLQDTGTCDVIPTSGSLGIPNARIIAPGDAMSSVLIERASRRDSHGMPPLGSNIVDSGGVLLLIDWVNSLSSCP